VEFGVAEEGVVGSEVAAAAEEGGTVAQRQHAPVGGQA
jgi:hypothetical protein